MSQQLPRNNWSRYPLPEELIALLWQVAKREGYQRDELHLFIYKLLKEARPEDVAAYASLFDAEWMDVPPGE